MGYRGSRREGGKIRAVSEGGTGCDELPDRHASWVNVDPKVDSVGICKDLSAWLETDGEAVYSSRPFEISEEHSNADCDTRNNGNVHASLKKVSKVETRGPDIRLVCEGPGLASGKLTIHVIHRGPGSVAVAAWTVR